MEAANDCRSVKSDEMGNWIWICEGLVIVFLTETCHKLLSSVKGGRERSKRERLRKAEELAIHPFWRYSWLS